MNILKSNRFKAAILATAIALLLALGVFSLLRNEWKIGFTKPDAASLPEKVEAYEIPKDSTLPIHGVYLFEAHVFEDGKYSGTYYDLGNMKGFAPRVIVIRGEHGDVMSVEGAHLERKFGGNDSRVISELHDGILSFGIVKGGVVVTRLNITVEAANISRVRKRYPGVVHYPNVLVEPFMAFRTAGEFKLNPSLVGPPPELDRGDNDTPR